jgi:hypothetical protein
MRIITHRLPPLKPVVPKHCYRLEMDRRQHRIRAAMCCHVVRPNNCSRGTTSEKTDTIMIRSLGREKKTRIILIQCIWQYLVNSGPDSGLCCVRCPLQAEQLQAAELVGHAWRGEPSPPVVCKVCAVVSSLSRPSKSFRLPTGNVCSSFQTPVVTPLALPGMLLRSPVHQRGAHAMEGEAVYTLRSSTKSGLPHHAIHSFFF